MKMKQRKYCTVALTSAAMTPTGMTAAAAAVAAAAAAAGAAAAAAGAAAAVSCNYTRAETPPEKYFERKLVKNTLKTSFRVFEEIPAKTANTRYS